jgi:hypothetical protein
MEADHGLWRSGASFIHLNYVQEQLTFVVQFIGTAFPAMMTGEIIM